jgi:hypothetical protein
MLELNNILKYLQDKTQEICYTHFKKTIQFTMDNFIDFTIILGNDYGHGIRCSGGNNREKLFELFVINDFDVVKYIAHLYQINKEVNYIKYYIPENFIEKWVMSRNNYKLAEIIDPSEINIYMNQPNFDDLMVLLLNKKFNKSQIEYISSSLNKLYGFYSKNNFKYDLETKINQHLSSKDHISNSSNISDDCNDCNDSEGWIVVKRGKK